MRDEEETAIDRTRPARDGAPSWRRFRLIGQSGPASEVRFEAQGDRCAIGSHESNDVVIADPLVSRFHCEIRAIESGLSIRDLGSRNGTIVDGVQVVEALVRDGSAIRIGGSSLLVSPSGETMPVRLSDAVRFGDLVGESAAMRAVFARLERAAAAEATVLLEGETGTGKEHAAEAIHENGARAAQPFVVIDCSAIPASLIEAELFGHEKGAFTGAIERRIGAFEEASGGTIFLDEIGELPLAMQPKLLRVLEQRTLRRVGASARIPIDVRVIAATNRSLKTEVNEGRFRPDLYYRLAVVTIVLPPLREHPEDMRMLADHLLASLGAGERERAKILAPEEIARLKRRAWPGNVRELRNVLEHRLVMDEALEGAPPEPELPRFSIDPTLGYAEARRRALAEFERAWAPALVDHHGGNVSEAARAAGMDRAYLHRLLKRHKER
jgi:two-component system, NtrC family, response regulator GlrR